MGIAAKKYNRFDICIFLLIFSLIFGNLGGAIMVVRVLAVLFLPLLYDKYKYCKSYLGIYIKFFYVFYLFCILSLLWTPNVDQALKELVYYPVHFLIFFEILAFSKFANNPLRTISWSWVLSVGITLLIAVWEITTNNHLALSKFEAEDISINYAGSVVGRPFATVTFGNFNGYVTFLCVAMPFLLYYLLKNKGIVKKMVFALVVIFVSVIVLLVNASRGGLLSILIMSTILFLESQKTGYKLILIILSYFIIIFLIVPNLETIFLGMSIKVEGDNLYTDDSRFIIWKDGLTVLVNYLFVGTGIGGMTEALRKVAHSQVIITHNMFLEILIQYGVLFFSVFLVYLFKILIRAFRTNDRDIKTILLMALIAMPLYSIIDSGYLLNPIIYVFLSCLTVFGYIEKINKKYMLFKYEKTTII